MGMKRVEFSFLARGAVERVAQHASLLGAAERRCGGGVKAPDGVCLCFYCTAVKLGELSGDSGCVLLVKFIFTAQLPVVESKYACFVYCIAYLNNISRCFYFSKSSISIF